MIADNLSFMNLPISALVPKDFSHSSFPLSRSQSMAQSSGCAVCESGSNTWTPVTDTIGFLKLLVALPLRMSAMTEKSFGSLISVKSGNGDDIASNPVVRNAFTYTGREWESEVDMFYYRARWYSPSVGRFLQSDPDPGRTLSPITVINKYTYTGNNPVLFTDPTGRIFGIDDGILLLIGTIAGGFVNDYQRQGGNFFQNFFEGMWQGFATTLATIFAVHAIEAIASSMKYFIKGENTFIDALKNISKTYASLMEDGGTTEFLKFISFNENQLFSRFFYTTKISWSSSLIAYAATAPVGYDIANNGYENLSPYSKSYIYMLAGLTRFNLL